MKKVYKTYWTSFLISIICVVIPHFLFDIISIPLYINMIIFFPIIGFVISGIYVARSVSSIKYRVFMILLNPIIYYFVFLIYVFSNLTFFEGL